MEDRLTTGRGPALALGALVLIALVTASWWALALWPLPPTTPLWVARAREVCFGNGDQGLPSTGGWILLAGEPVGLVTVLLAVWGGALREGLRRLMRSPVGRLTLGLAVLMFLTSLGWTFGRIRQLGAATLPPSVTQGPEPMDAAAPDFHLVNQAGDTVGPGQYLGRPLLVTFAYGHCETVCPTVVHDLVTARERLGDRAPDLLIVTLDPWRDTPARLGAIAKAWGLPPGVHLLSGDTVSVERVLDGWRVPRVRDLVTGEITHARVAYLVGRNGRIAYRLDGRIEGVLVSVPAVSPG